MDTGLEEPLARLEAGQRAHDEALRTIQQQNLLVLELLERLAALLAPQDRDGPRLEDLLARMIAQQTAIIELARQTAAGVARIELALTEPARSGRPC